MSGVPANGGWKFLLPSVLLCVLFSSAGCRSKTSPKTETQLQVGWRPIASFSGRGDTQTESFDIDSPQWRIKWETKGAASLGAGSFHLVVHSAVSGRPIQDAVLYRGNGRGVAYVTDDPRLYHLVIDSSGLDWSLQVEEAVLGVPNPRVPNPR